MRDDTRAAAESGAQTTYAGMALALLTMFGPIMAVGLLAGLLR